MNTVRLALLTLALGLLAGCGGSIESVEGFAIAAPADGEKIASGTLAGRSDHATSGTASLVETDDGVVLVLGPDFSFDGAPDPKVGLGRAGEDRPAVLLAPLASDNGAQAYTLPAEVSNLDAIWLWCELFDVPLGYAQVE